MAKDSEVKLDEKQELINATTSIRIDLDLGVDKIITDLKRIQREAKNATQAIKGLELAKNNMNRDKEIEILLDLASKNGFLLTAVSETSRGKGKTTAIVNKAKKENLLIVVGTVQMIDYIRPNSEPDIECITPDRLFSLGLNFKKYNGFITDDGVPNKLIETIKNYTGLQFKGGFNTLSVSIK